MNRTAKGAGWHISRYNLCAPIPGTDKTAIVNLYKGSCAVYSPLEMYLLSVAEELDDDHPILKNFAKRGLIANFDERAALEAYGRAACGYPLVVGLTLCPTMGCNFDCPYCFEKHCPGKMSQKVQDEVVSLAENMLSTSGARMIHITWFGGEPLLVPDVIESLSERLIGLAEKYQAEYKAGIVTNGYLLTQEIVDMLERVKVTSAQITLDGVGAAHDATRHLAGGGPTFERITDNLRKLQIPFPVSIRQNVHVGNYGEVAKLQSLIQDISQESGNRLICYPAPVTDNEAARQRGSSTRRICGSEAMDVGILENTRKLERGRGHYCGVHSLWSAVVDDEGRLYKCWETAGDVEKSFGNASSWTPKNPFEMASRLDNLTAYLNTAQPNHDEECRDCIWLPVCRGGCPSERLKGMRPCVPYRDHAEEYVLALYRNMERNKKGRKR